MGSNPILGIMDWIPDSILEKSTNPKALNELNSRKEKGIKLTDMLKWVSAIHLCEICGENILMDRVNLSKDKNDVFVRRCQKHSDAVRAVGLMEYGHKTAGYVVISRQGEESEEFRLMKRAYKRARDR